MSLIQRLSYWFRRYPVVATEAEMQPQRATLHGPVDHVIILDGTLSTLLAGHETNAGQAFHLLGQPGPWPRRRIYYEPGMQWEGWRNLLTLAEGRGINRQIRRAYGWLASQYRPGDRIFLFGYSRGAYAVRSLAGMLDRVGLLRHDCATERNVTHIYRHYKSNPEGHAARVFSHKHCHPEAPIEMVGVWDTVKALGLRVPFFWMFSEQAHAFHNHHLGASIRRGFHALAIDETRIAFAPVMWDCPPGWEGDVQQMWFRGAHGDVGGQIGVLAIARPLANIPFVWMMERASDCGLGLPDGWQDNYPRDILAPMVGSWHSWGKLFLARRHRPLGTDPSERLHPSVPEPEAARWRRALADLAGPDRAAPRGHGSETSAE